MIHEIKIKKHITKEGIALLLREKSDDNFLTQLTKYLFEHRLHISWILNVLQDVAAKEYGGNMMYTKLNGPSIIIYDYYHEEPEEHAIEINRADLIEIFQAWSKLNEQIEPQGGIQEIVLQRDEEHINMIAHYEDGSKFQKTFNYKVRQ